MWDGNDRCMAPIRTKERRERAPEFLETLSFASFTAATHHPTAPSSRVLLKLARPLTGTLRRML